MSLSGDPFRLSNLKGMVVVLDFWGTWCGPCSEEMASLERLRSSLSGKAVQIGYDISQGKKPEQELTLIPVDLITKENVDQYKGWTK